MKVSITPTINNCVEINIPQELQSEYFADEFLKIQDLCNKHYDKIQVHFCQTLWIDNLVMIHLFLFLYKFWKLGKKISFYLDYDPESVEQVRFIKYMDDYGFLNIIEEMDSEFEHENVLECYSGDAYKELSKGNFENSECFFRYKIISKKEMISETIDGIISIFHKRFVNSFSTYEREDFAFHISVFLQETISNVFDHAFEDERDAFCGVMIRYIHKNDSNNVNQKHREYYSLQDNNEASRPFRNGNFTYKEHRQLAEKDNPYRNKTGMNVLENYMQIFVADIGMGILDSMGISDVRDERNLINEIFQKGKRSRKKVRNTLVGGLGMLYQLLQNKENYISVKGEYNWATISCSNKREKDGTLNYTHKTGKMSRNILKGFTIIGYIDCDYKVKKELFVTIPESHIKNIYQDGYILNEMKQIDNVDILDLRWGIPDLSKISFNSNTVISFAGLNIDKSIWSNKIAYSFKTQREGNTFILVDIPEREIRKYELIFEGFSGNIDRVILLSMGYSLAVFTRTDGKQLHFSTEETQTYISSKEHNISMSLYELLLEIRKYDSQKFWNTVSETQKAQRGKLFINGIVEWNISNNNQMDGYLDFSQACFDDRIRKILIYQLYRIPNSKGNGNYFISMDRFTEDLCENINGNLKILSEGEYNSSVQLGSVYVTGTSSKGSKLEERNSDDSEYYCFSHPSAMAEDDHKINALLLWPSKENADILFERDNQSSRFRRLAKTPFLSPQGTVYFAEQHYKDIKDSVDLKPNEFYEILQSESVWVNRLIKIAHIDTIDHHDHIYLNVVALFHKHYMESCHSEKYAEKNSFDYMLKKMYIALGRTKRKSYAKTAEMDIQPQYRDIVMEKIKESIIPYDPGLFVYLTDYETMEIMSVLKEFFSEKVQERIIPIAPISKKRVASALLVSPVLMENIKEKLEKIKKENPDSPSRVTIFIASVTSTRLQRELKHILYRLGAKEIKCLCLIDRQRFPLGSRESESYNSFSKLDLPHLGSENRCKMCQGINRIAELQTQLISQELKDRCKQIAFIWGEVKISDNLYKRGVCAQSYIIPDKLNDRIREICRQYQVHKIKICTDVGLVLFSVEYASITMSIDFLMDCLKDNLVNDQVKMLMISAHLILFGTDEIVPADKYYLTRHLYELLLKQEESNEYTALASITILLQKSNIHEKLHNYYKQKFRYRRFNNIDFIITSVGIMINVEKEKQDDVLRYWVKKSPEEHLEYLYGVFLFTDGSQETRHRTILSRMRETGWKLSDMDYLSADNDAGFLEDAYQKMPHSFFINPEDYQEKREKVVAQIKSLREILKKAIDGSAFDVDRQELSLRVNSMFQETKEFNQGLFMNSDAEQLVELQKKLYGIAAELKKHTVNQAVDVECYIKKIQYKEEYGIKYFCYLEDLQREILYLMMDFRHSDKRNPMIGDDNKQYNGIVEIIFEKDAMRYCFTNHVKEDFSFEDVKKKKKLKHNRPTILSLRTLFSEKENDNLFCYNYNKDYSLFTVELRVPYLIV